MGLTSRRTPVAMVPLCPRKRSRNEVSRTTSRDITLGHASRHAVATAATGGRCTEGATAMRNVWKGLVIGGLTGSLVGALNDVLRAENLERMAQRARGLGADAADRAKMT